MGKERKSADTAYLGTGSAGGRTGLAEDRWREGSSVVLSLVNYDEVLESVRVLRVDATGQGRVNWLE